MLPSQNKVSHGTRRTQKPSRKSSVLSLYPRCSHKCQPLASGSSRPTLLRNARDAPFRPRPSRHPRRPAPHPILADPPTAPRPWATLLRTPTTFLTSRPHLAHCTAPRPILAATLLFMLHATTMRPPCRASPSRHYHPRQPSATTSRHADDSDSFTHRTSDAEDSEAFSSRAAPHAIPYRCPPGGKPKEEPNPRVVFGNNNKYGKKTSIIRGFGAQLSEVMRMVTAALLIAFWVGTLQNAALC